MNEDSADNGAATATSSHDDKFESMMLMMTEALVAMKNISQDNQRLNQQIMQMKQEKLDGSRSLESGPAGSKSRLKPTRPSVPQ